jgi:hypothetical protein
VGACFEPSDRIHVLKFEFMYAKEERTFERGRSIDLDDPIHTSDYFYANSYAPRAQQHTLPFLPYADQ